MARNLLSHGVSRRVRIALGLGVLLGGLAWPWPALAQGRRADGPNYWRHYNTSNSDIPSDNVQAIAYTEDVNVDVAIPGLWVGTDAGLSYTNGRDWIDYDTSSSDIPTDTVQAIVTGHGSGELWIGTAVGVARLDYAGTPRNREDDTWEIFAVADGQPAADVRSLALGQDDEIWVGAIGGLVCYDSATWRDYTDGLSSSLKAHDLEISDLAYDAGRDGLWVATGDGVGFLDLRSKEWDGFRAGDSISQLPSDDVHALAVSADGRVWIGTAGGLAALASDGTWETWVPGKPGLPDYPVTDLSLDPTGRYLWVATEGGGASRYDIPADHWDRFNTLGSQLRNDRVQVVLATHETTAWLGTAAGLSGVERPWETYHFLAPRVPGLLASSRIETGWVDPKIGTVWVGTDGGGVSRSDDGGATWRTFTTAEGLGGNDVHAVWGDGARAVWVGTAGGVSRSDDGGATWQTFTPAEGLGDNTVWSVWGDDAGTVWVGTAGGVSRSDDGGATWQTFTTANDLWSGAVLAVWGDGAGMVWVGTDGSGVRRSGDGGATWQTFTTAEGLGGDIVTSVWGDGAGTVWVGTHGGGVSRSDDGGATWRTFTTADRLGGDFVNSVWGDGAGTVWAGTWGGVSRSDDGGTTWQTFTTADGLGDDNVSSVWGDGAGTAWVGTLGGVSRSDDKGASWRTFSTANGPRSAEIRAVWGDGTGTVWVGTLGGLSRTDDGGANWRTFTTADGLESNAITSVWGNRSGVVWVGTWGGGVSRSADGGATWQTFTGAEGLGSDHIMSVWGDDTGTVWVGTGGGGVSRSDDDGATWRTFSITPGLSDHPILVVWGDGAGTVWVGTDGGGVSRSDDGGATWQTFTTAQGLSDNKIRAVWGDDTGTVWVGTDGGGVSRSDDGGVTWQTFTTAEGLGDNDVRTVWGDGAGIVWVGTSGGGVSRSNDGGTSWQTFTAAQGLADNKVSAVWGDGAGTVWVGTWSGGVSRSNDDGMTWRTFTAASGLGTDEIWAVWGNGAGTVWVGTNGGGVSRSDDGGATWQTFTTAQGLSDNKIRAVWGDDTGTVWVGTEGGGVSRSDDGGATWQTFTTAHGLGDNEVWAVWGDDSDTVWVGTFGGGVSRSTDSGASWQTFLTDHGLRDNKIWAVWEDGAGTVWVGTDRGGVSRSDDSGVSWETFTTTHGLGSNEVRAVWGDRAGTIWVGTLGGMSRSDDGGVSWETFTTTHGLGSNEVRAVWEDDAGMVWAGTYGGGVSRSTDSGGANWRTFTTVDGLGDDKVRTVWGDGVGTVWVGTSGGASRLALAAGPAPLAQWLTPQALVDGSSFRLLDDTPRTLQAQFAGLNLAPVGDVMYDVVLSAIAQSQAFSETFTAREIGEAGIAQVSLPAENGDEPSLLPYGDYELSLVTTDQFGRILTLTRTVQVQARPLLILDAPGQEGVCRTITLTSTSRMDLIPLTVTFTIIDPDSLPASVVVSYTWDPAGEPDWQPLDGDVIVAGELVAGSHVLSLRARDPDGNVSLEPLALPVQVQALPSHALTWLLIGVLAAYLVVGPPAFSLRHYPSYAGAWTAAEGYPLQQIILLVVPSGESIDGERLRRRLRTVKAFSTGDQAQEALTALVERGMMQREGDAYRYAYPWAARVHRWTHSRHVPALAERVRTQHPLYARTRGFFTQARFRMEELGTEEFLLTPQGQDHPQVGYGPMYARLITGRPPRGEDFTDACNASRRHYGVDLSHRVALLVSDRRPEPGARYRLYEIREREGLAIVPLDSALFGQIKPNRTTNDILASEIDQATGQQNLYAISGPVSSDLSFFGRERVLQDIIDLLDAGQPVGVFGLRKVGKTSLVQRLQGRLAGQRPIAFVDTQGTVRQRGVWPLYPAIIAAFMSHLEHTRPNLKLPDLRLYPEAGPLSPTTAERFLQDLRVLHATLGQPDQEERMLLIVDEVDRLLPAGRTPGYEGFAAFFGQLRAANQQARLLDFLLAGVDPAVNRHERWRDHDNELYRALREVWMPPMAAEDVREMVESLGSQMGVRYEAEALELLIRAGGGHPFVTRQLCSRAVESRLGKGAITVMPDQAQAAIEEFIFQDRYLPEMWRTRLDNAQREMLRALARASAPLSRARLLPPARRQAALAALGALEEATLVCHDEAGYVIAWAVLRDWIRWVELGLKD